MKTSRSICGMRCLKHIVILQFSLGSSGNASNQLTHPCEVYRNSTTGTLFIADVGNHRIMQYLSGASAGTVVAGGNGMGISSTQLHHPYCFTYDSFSNSLIISNYGIHNVVRWVLGASSWTTLLAGSASGTSGSTSTLLHGPLGVQLDAFRNMYVADYSNHRIQFFLSGQSNGTTIAGTSAICGNTTTQLCYPFGLLLDSQFSFYVADRWNHRIQKFIRF